MTVQFSTPHTNPKWHNQWATPGPAGGAYNAPSWAHTI